MKCTCQFKRPSTAILVFGLLACPVQTASASDWDSGIGGLWFDAGNWAGGIPDAQDATAEFGQGLPAGDASIDLGGGEVTLGMLSANTSDNITLINGTLTFDQSGPGTSALIGVASGQLTVDTAILLHDGLVLDVGADAELWLTQALLGGADLTIAGNGTVVLDHDAGAWNGTLNIQDGFVAVFDPSALGAGSVTNVLGGQLRLVGDVDEAIVVDGGELRLQNSGTYSMQIELGDGRIVADNRATLTGSLHLLSGGSAELNGSFVLDTNVTGNSGITWRLHNGFSEVNASMDFTGDLIIDSSSAFNRLDFNTASTYTGTTELSVGRVNVYDPLGLGDDGAGTVVHSGELAIYAMTQEAITLHPSGTLSIRDGGGIGSLTSFGGELVHYGEYETSTLLAGGETRWYAINERVDSVITGTGDLRIGGATIYSANSYTGTTTINGYQPVITMHAMALGSADGETVVDGGRLLIDVASMEPIRVANGFVEFRATDAPNRNPLTLAGGHAAAPGGHAGEVFLESESTLGFGRFTGPISGAGRLILGDDSPTNELTIAGQNPFAGVVWSSEGDVVFERPDVFNHAERIIHVTDRLLLVDGSDRTLMVAGGQLHVEGDTTLGGLWHIGGRVTGGGAVTFDRAVASHFNDGSEPAGTVTVNEFLVIESLSLITSAIQGDGDIIFDHAYSDVYGDLSGLNGDIVMHRGEMRGYSTNAFGNAGTTIRFTEGSTASVRAETEDDPTNTIIQTLDATATDLITIAGNTSGAILLSDGFRLDARELTIAGTIDAHDLTITGGSLIANDLTGLTGDVTVTRYAGRIVEFTRDPVLLTVGEQGGIHDADRIFLTDASGLLFENDFLDSPDSATSQDRLGELIEIISDGGYVWLTGHTTQDLSETLGTLTLRQGRTQVQAQGTAGTDTTLVLSTVQRQDRSTLGFYRNDFFGGEIRLFSPGVQTGEMIGPWAVTLGGFATVDAQGFVTTLAATSTDLNTAGAADHVRLLSSQLLGASATINSAVVGEYGQQVVVDLGGNTLTLDSGGLFVDYNSRFHNGVVTSGTDELVLTAPATQFNRRESALLFFDADIQDNGAAVALVIDSLDVEFRGAQQHTGGTWAHNSSISIRTLDGIPSFGDLHLFNSSYGIDLIENEAGPMPSFGVITLAGDAGFRGVSYDGENRPVLFEEIRLEDSGVGANLYGDGLIIVEGSGVSSLAEMPNFTGEIRVLSGRLFANRLHEDVSINVLGGVFDVRAAPSADALPINLAGGTLFNGTSFGVQYNVVVSADSYLTDVELRGAISGDYQMTVRHGQTNEGFGALLTAADLSGFTGDWLIESGMLSVRPNAGGVGTGDITIRPGATLELWSSSLDDPLASDIVFDGGGTLRINGNSRHLGVFDLSGVSYFHPYYGTSSQGTIELAGQVLLRNGLSIISRGGNEDTPDGQASVMMTGQVLVGQDVRWNTGLGNVEISGTVRPDTADASLMFAGLMYVPASQATFETLSGRTLTLRDDIGPGTIFLRDGGSIVGDGTLAADVFVEADAWIAPGYSIGQLSVDGDIWMRPGSRLRVEIDNLEVGAGVGYDQLVVTGTFGAGGLLDLSAVAELSPQIGETYDIVLADEVVGHFDAIQHAAFDHGIGFRVQYLPTRVQLEAGLLGDLTGDGFVDVQDLDLLLANWGDTTVAGDWFAGDADGDGSIGQGDLTVVLDHWSNGTPPSPQIPEPSSILLLAPLLWRWHRR